MRAKTFIYLSNKQHTDLHYRLQSKKIFTSAKCSRTCHDSIYGKRKYSFSHLYPWHQMEMGVSPMCQLLYLQRKNPEQEVVSASKAGVEVLGNLLPLNPTLSIPQANHYIGYASSVIVKIRNICHNLLLLTFKFEVLALALYCSSGCCFFSVLAVSSCWLSWFSSVEYGSNLSVSSSSLQNTSSKYTLTSCEM